MNIDQIEHDLRHVFAEQSVSLDRHFARSDERVVDGAEKDRPGDSLGVLEPLEPTFQHSAVTDSAPFGLEAVQDQQDLSRSTIDGSESPQVAEWSSERRWYWAVAASIILLVGVVGLDFFSSRGLGTTEPVGSDLDDWERVNERSGRSWFADPNGDALVVGVAIGERVGDCMETSGYDWQPQEAQLFALGLPRFTLDGHETVGYEPAFSAMFGTSGVSERAGFHDAYFGPGDDPADFVHFGDSRSRDMGGCLGAGHRAILHQDELVVYLAGADVLGNLLNQVREEALDKTDVLERWASCVEQEGLQAKSPFSLTSASRRGLSEQAAVVIDARCRERSGLEASYEAALGDVLNGRVLWLEQVVADAFSDDLDDFVELNARVRQRIEDGG